MYEPWIPADGKDYSLMGLLENAHRISRISCASPLETYAVYRLVIAFVMDALRMPNKDVRHRLIGQPPFDMEAIKAYVRLCEQEGASFDLFDEKRPFMQAPYDAEWSQEPKPIAGVVLTLPSGNNHVFFDHRMEDQHTLQPDEALRAMLAKYVFSTAGVQGYPSSVNNTPCIYALVEGSSVYETLLLNAVSLAECRNLQYGLPAWRSRDCVVPKQEYANVDLLQAFTWMPRRITLIEEDSGLSMCYFRQGQNFTGNALWRDPHVPYIVSKKGEEITVKPQLYRAFWRDIGALSVSNADRFGKPPLTIRNVPDMYEHVRILLTGLVTNQASSVDIAVEEVRIPKSILLSLDKGEMLRYDMQFVEENARSLNRWFSYHSTPVIADGAVSAFLMQLHHYVFGAYFISLANCREDQDYLKLMEDVEQQVLKSLLSVIQKHAARIGFDAESMRKRALIQKSVLCDYMKKKEERKKNHE